MAGHGKAGHRGWINVGQRAFMSTLAHKLNESIGSGAADWSHVHILSMKTL
jgi:hypothetical protein